MFPDPQNRDVPQPWRLLGRRPPRCLTFTRALTPATCMLSRTCSLTHTGLSAHSHTQTLSQTHMQAHTHTARCIGHIHTLSPLVHTLTPAHSCTLPCTPAHTHIIHVHTARPWSLSPTGWPGSTQLPEPTKPPRKGPLSHWAPQMVIDQPIGTMSKLPNEFGWSRP